ncbi:MAG TPA: hypothetical protein VKQ31_06130, partial [Steroidobacteraceae bacterium]|nr:hypothetical protein [Steroidobacteraceae bacterium]
QVLTLQPNASAPAGADPSATIPSADNGSGASGRVPQLPSNSVGTKQLMQTAAKVKANLPPFPGPFLQRLMGGAGGGDPHGPPYTRPGPTRKSVNGATGLSVKPPPRLPIAQTTMAKKAAR